VGFGVASFPSFGSLAFFMARGGMGTAGVGTLIGSILAIAAGFE
jgi:hypothetical protein